MKVPNASAAISGEMVSLSRLQNEGSQLYGCVAYEPGKSIKATE